MYEMKTKGLGFAEACEIKPGSVVVVGGVLRRVLEAANDVNSIQDGNVGALVALSMSPPLFLLDGLGWVSWQNCAVYAGRSVKELAQEAIQIQDACNPLGLSKGYAKALQELRWALEVEGEENDTDAIRLHPINRLWLDKLCDLANYQRGVCGVDGWGEFAAAYGEVSRLAEDVRAV